MSRFWVLAGVALLAVAAYAHTTRAHRLRAQLTAQIAGAGANDPYVRRWYASDGLPKPKGTVYVNRATPDATQSGAGADAGMNPDGSVTINLSDAPGLNSPATFYHELGHAYDDQNLNDLARARVRAYMHQQAPWGAQGAAQAGQPNPPREVFADLYSLLANHPWVAQNRRGFNRYMRYEDRLGNGTPKGFYKGVDVGHGAVASYYQLRKVRKLIDSLG